MNFITAALLVQTFYADISSFSEEDTCCPLWPLKESVQKYELKTIFKNSPQI